MILIEWPVSLSRQLAGWQLNLRINLYGDNIGAVEYIEHMGSDLSVVNAARVSFGKNKKELDENLNIQGKKSITLPLGETRISRKVNALTVIFRSCTSVNMLTQNKKRLFDKEKSEYTFRSLNSIIKSLNHSKKTFPN